mmetsp:Transcript_15392/g.31719  ORF Transcript_15392/g.31719 Transcript_15392/m.31719 type:complete len:1960 (+) Transcript_15392:197-6076(+)
MPSRTLKVEVVAGTVVNDTSLTCSVKLLDLALRELKKETFKTKSVKKSNGLPFMFPANSFVIGTTYNLANADSLPTLEVSFSTISSMTTNSKAIGNVKIPLETIDQHTETQDSEYTLRIGGLSSEQTGTVRLKLTWSSSLEDGGSATAMSAAEEIVEDEYPDAEPNELHVSILRAKDLLIMDRAMIGKGSSDPRAVVSVGSETRKTEVMEKNLNPVWLQKFIFKTDNYEDSIVVTIEDVDMGGLKTDFIGKIVVPLVQLQTKQPMRQWKRLLNKAGKADATKRGEVEVLFHWKHNPEVQIHHSSQGGVGGMLADAMGLAESSDEEAAEQEHAEATPKTDEEIAKENEEKEEREKKLREELGNIEIKSGDYQIQVHIIEVRDLKAEDLNGQSDPVVYVEAFGQKQNTKVMESCLSCVFDERFIMNFRNMDKETFDAGQIRVNVMDADFGGRNDMIGAFVVDASRIYYRKGHEFYREWVGLIDDTSVGDSGIQGYLKLSISIIGPGDKLVVHDEESDKKLEKEREEKEGIKAAIPPSIKRENVYLVTTIHRAEYLPVMDSSNLISNGGIDAFFQCELGTARQRTKTKTIKGDRSQLNPEWNSELWLPVTIPIMSDIIKYTVWDADRTGNYLVSTCTDRFNVLNGDSDKSTPPHWRNLYGAQINGYEIGKAFSKFAAEKDWKAHYNKYPENAPHYRGRILISQRIESKPPPKKDGSDRVDEAFRLKLPRRIKQSEQPPQETYKIRAMIISGTEIPKFMRALHVRKMQVKIQCGKNEIYSSRVENTNGVCEWYELIETEPFLYPKDPDQIPDIIVSICKGKETSTVPIAFKRFKFQDVMNENFQNESQWVTFGEDKALDLLNNDQFPGSVLMRLGCGKSDLADRTRHSWESSLSSSTEKTPYQLRCHIYQARSLPASDANGLMDPYFAINFNGMNYNSRSAKTIKNGRADHKLPSLVKKKTCDPLWYKTICFDTQLPDPQFFPQVNFQLFDWDAGLDPDDYCGCFNALLTEENITDADDTELKTPSWFSLMKEEEGDSEGEILCCFQLIKKRAPEMVMPDIPDISPELMDAFIEVVVIGCRDLSPYQMMPMQFPKVEFSVDSPDGARKQATDNSKRPSGSNPNFLERIVLPCKMPVDAIFAPPMTVRLFDYRLAGMFKPICGVTKVDLSTKLPWSDDFINPLGSGSVCAREKAGGIVLKAASVAEKAKRRKSGIAMTSIDQAPQAGPEQVSLNVNDSISPVSPLLPDDMRSAIEEKLSVEDTGAGVFGALKHVKQPMTGVAGKKVGGVTLDDGGGEEKKVQDSGGWLINKTDEELAKILEDMEEEEDNTARYMIGREKIPTELEDKLKTTPFETFALFRGQKESRVQVGVVKGLIRVVRDEKELELKGGKNHGGLDIKELLKPALYTVRLYVLRGLSLTPMDIGMFGRPGKSDPYLKVNVGDDKFNDRKNYISDATDVDFYKCVELHTELPGASLLEVELMDYDAFGFGDDLIGKTVIDLEDRWFDERWRNLGKENQVEEEGKMRWATKPLERRSLYVPTSHSPQGTLECYVDIMPNPIAEMYPMDDIALPPSQMFEVRVIVWRAREMVSMDAMEDMNDLYFSAWVEGCDKQTTDTHWRARNGKGSFNWRMKFDVELGHNTKAMKFPYFHIQAWDKDIFKYNDCIAESFVNLGKAFKRAYKKGQSVDVYKKRDYRKEIESLQFKKMQEKARKEFEEKKREEAKIEREQERMSIITEEEDVDDDIEMGLPRPSDPVDEGEGVQLVERGQAKSDAYAPIKKSKSKGYVKSVQERARTISKAVSLKEMKKKKAEQYHKDREIAKVRKEKAAQADKDELDQLVGSMKEMCGLGADPPDSEWITLMRKDFNTGEEEECGEVAISISIVPKTLADTNPVGFGRKEPNSDPYLPGPQGRLKFTLNPFSMGAQIFGPAICAKIACICCCIGGAILLYFIAPFLNIFFTLAK